MNDHRAASGRGSERPPRGERTSPAAEWSARRERGAASRDRAGAGGVRDIRAARAGWMVMRRARRSGRRTAPDAAAERRDSGDCAIAVVVEAGRLASARRNPATGASEASRSPLRGAICGLSVAMALRLESGARVDELGSGATIDAVARRRGHPGGTSAAHDVTAIRSATETVAIVVRVAKGRIANRWVAVVAVVAREHPAWSRSATVHAHPCVAVPIAIAVLEEPLCSGLGGVAVVDVGIVVIDQPVAIAILAAALFRTTVLSTHASLPSTRDARLGTDLARAHVGV